MTLHRFADAPGAAQGCAARILELLRDAVKERGSATLAVSGGSSPKVMFEIFAKSGSAASGSGGGFDWTPVHLFFVDERAVPPTDPQSNFKLANDAWLAHSPCSPLVHRVQAELGAEEAARSYQSELRRLFKLQEGQMPHFDVIHRGMGPDSHTASLFPGEPLIKDRTGTCAAVWAKTMNQWRVTLLPAVLEAAKHTVVLAPGADKASALEATLNGPYDPVQHPAQIARETAEWFVDRAAAAELGPL
jgi:6-phosphogluconolactonase